MAHGLLCSVTVGRSPSASQFVPFSDQTFYRWRIGTSEAAARMANRRETGLDIEIFRALRVESGFRLRIAVYFEGRVIGGSLVLDATEIIEARFCSLDSLPDGLMPTSGALVEEIARYR